METRIKLLGHPIHPMLIVFPVGLLPTGTIFDLVYLVTGRDEFARVAFWLYTVGLLGGLAAALFGLIDWLGIPGGTRARRIGLWHGAGNAVAVLLFAASWLLRIPDQLYAPNLTPFVLALLATSLALVTSWLGGELVYRLGVAVDSDAHLDASNSLAEAGLVSTA